MKDVPFGSDVSALESCMKNKWRWAWLTEEEEDGDRFQIWCKKIDQPGMCLCIVCGKTLNYSTSGKRARYLHARDKGHKAALVCAKLNAKLDGASQTTVTKAGFGDRVAELKTIVTSFAAQHTLPFSLLPHLVSLGQRLAEDKEALQKLTFSRTSGTYTTVYGVAEAMKHELAEKLKQSYFSLNMDEATNNAGDKIFNVVVQYYCTEQGKVVLEHFGSREVNRATASNLFDAVDDMMREKGLEWKQVVSCMMDNCNVMRGCRGGVEKLCRDKNPHLLDISGDTLHVINNACKALFAQVEQVMPFTDIVSSIFYDIEESPKGRDVLRELQTLLNYNVPKSIIRPVGSRFLQMQTVADRLHEILDSLLIYFFAYLTVEEQRKHQSTMLEIFHANNVSEECQARIKVVLQQQRKQQTKTGANISRKDKILDTFFTAGKKSLFLIIMNLYRGILDIFSGYVKKFQAEKPLMHKVHSDLFSVTREFFSQFIDPEHIPSYDVSQLIKLKFFDSSLQLSDKCLGVGPHCFNTLKAYRRDREGNPWLTDFYKALRKGYEEAAKIMLKLPLENEALIRLSALDPGAQRSKTTPPSLMKLADQLPNVVPDDQLGNLDSELRSYTVDAAITHIEAEETDPTFRLDSSWWSRIFQMQSNGQQKYPVLAKLVKALLSIFSGPLIESTFNIMDDIITDDRTSLRVRHYEGVVTIKSWLKANNTSATEMKVSQKMKKYVQESYQNYQCALNENKRYHAAEREKRLKEATEMEQAKQSTDSLHVIKPSTSPSAPVQSSKAGATTSKAASLSTTSKTASLSTTCKTASLSSTSKTASLSTTCKTASLSTTCKTASLSTTCKTASLSSTSKAASLSSTSKAASLSTTYKTASLSTTSKTASLSSTSKAASLSTTSKAACLSSTSKTTSLSTTSNTAATMSSATLSSATKTATLSCSSSADPLPCTSSPTVSAKKAAENSGGSKGQANNSNIKPGKKRKAEEELKDIRSFFKRKPDLFD